MTGRKNVYQDLHNCRNCKRPYEAHAHDKDGKCLFGATTWYPQPLVEMNDEEMQLVQRRISAKRSVLRREIVELESDIKEMDNYEKTVIGRRREVCTHLNPDGSDAIREDAGLGKWCHICGWNDY